MVFSFILYLSSIGGGMDRQNKPPPPTQKQRGVGVKTNPLPFPLSGAAMAPDKANSHYRPKAVEEWVVSGKRIFLPLPPLFGS